MLRLNTYKHSSTKCNPNRRTSFVVRSKRKNIEKTMKLGTSEKSTTKTTREPCRWPRRSTISSRRYWGKIKTVIKTLSTCSELRETLSWLMVICLKPKKNWIKMTWIRIKILTQRTTLWFQDLRISPKWWEGSDLHQNLSSLHLLCIITKERKLP